MLLGANELGGAITGFLFWFIAARLYPQEDIGSGVALVTVAALLALLGTLGFNVALVRFLPGAGERATTMMSGALVLGTASSLVLTVGFLAGLFVWAPALVPVLSRPA